MPSSPRPVRSISLGLVLCLCSFASTPGWGQERPAAAAAPSKAKSVVATLTVRGELAESAGQVGLFGELEENLGRLIQRLQAAANDSRTAAVILKIRQPNLNYGRLHELRGAIAAVRKTGKRVIADCESATMLDYLLACACDEIRMPESGVVMIPGIQAEVTFYKDLFDKLGVRADMMQVGDFKGAAEPYTRSGMSPAFRKQYEALLDDLYDQLATMIAEGRKLDPAAVRERLDTGLFTAHDAAAAGLIDRVVYEDQLVDELPKTLGVESLEFVKDYGKQKVDTDFSGMVGIIKLFEMMLGKEPTKRVGSKKRIAVIYATGMIMPGKSEAGILGDSTLGSDTLVKAIREAEADKAVVALVLRVDSPGGSSLASDLIWRALQECQKPVIASMGDVAASGGYYISVGCDKIYAEPGTLTGSIGVVGGKVVMKGLYDKVGLGTEVIRRGRNSGLLSADTAFSESEREAFLKTMQTVYDQFVTKTAQGRKLTKEQVLELAGGRVWTGRQAQQNGLVDALGTLADAVADAKQQAGLEASEEVDLLLMPSPTNMLDQLLGLDTEVSSRVTSQLVEPWRNIAPGLTGLARQLQILNRLFSEPAVCILPCQVEIK